MKKVTDHDLYQCHYCNRVGTAAQIGRCEAEHEEEKRKREEQAAEYQRKVEERKEQALEWVRTNEPVKLLVRHGHDAEARLLCSKWVGWNCWDCGTSSGHEVLYGEMVAEARKTSFASGGVA